MPTTYSQDIIAAVRQRRDAEQRAAAAPADSVMARLFAARASYLGTIENTLRSAFVPVSERLQ